MLIAQPELLDALGPARPGPGRGPRAVLRAAFGEFAAPGAEDADRLRLFKQREELEIAWRDLVLGERPTRVAWALGELAEASVGIALGAGRRRGSSRPASPWSTGAPCRR